MLRSDINLHKCVCMEPLYPPLKVMPDASIVLQVKDSREKDRNTPSGCREGRAMWEHQDFSLFYVPPLSFFSFRSLLSPGRYKRRRIELRQTESSYQDISVPPTGSRSSVLFQVLYMSQMTSQADTHTQTHIRHVHSCTKSHGPLHQAPCNVS